MYSKGASKFRPRHSFSVLDTQLDHGAEISMVPSLIFIYTGEGKLMFLNLFVNYMMNNTIQHVS